MSLTVDQRYQAIRDFKYNFQLSISETSQNLGIAYQTVVNAQNNLSPKPRTYDKKLKEAHKIFIHVKTLFDPHLSGDSLAKMIFDDFGLVVSGRTVNRCRNEIELQYRAPIRSTYISEEAAVKRQFWTKFHLDNHTHFRNVAFSDESWFQLDRNNRWVWFDKNNITDGMYSKSQPHPLK